jgi:hypothetical protein
MADEEEKPEQINFEDEFRRYARAEPFVPFDIVVTSGDRYEVTNSDQVAFTGNAVVVALPKHGIRFFRKSQIVAVHVHEPSI